MKTIHKVKLPIRHVAEALLQEGAKILCVQIQKDDLCLWAEVDTSKDLERRQFYIFGTGHDLPEKKGAYIGTVQQGSFVWHVYEIA